MTRTSVYIFSGFHCCAYPEICQEYEQGMDLEIKEEKSDEAMRAAASTMCESYRELVSLQRWRKPSEGETMGTCSRRYTR